jgi:hypothetical protein
VAGQFSFHERSWWGFLAWLIWRSERFVAAVKQDRDKLTFKFKLAVDKGNAAALVSFLRRDRGCERPQQSSLSIR